MTNVQGVQSNPNLSSYARLLGPSLGSFIADQVFPTVEVPTLTGKFIDIDNGFASASPGHDIVMADGQERPLTIPLAFTRTTGWDVNQRGLGIRLDQRTKAALGGEGIDMDQAATAILARHFLILKERLAAAVAFSATAFSGHTAALAGGDRWDTSTGDPIDDMMGAEEDMLSSSGAMLNTLIVGYQVHRKLRSSAQLINRLVWSGKAPGALSVQQVKDALGVENYFVGTASSNTAVDGQAASKSFIWGKSALFCHIDAAPIPHSPQSALARFKLRGSEDGAVKKYMLPGNYVEQMDMLADDQYASPGGTSGLGYLYTTVVS